jgi:hypothetical protein
LYIPEDIPQEANATTVYCQKNLKTAVGKISVVDEAYKVINVNVVVVAYFNGLIEKYCSWTIFVFEKIDMSKYVSWFVNNLLIVIFVDVY